MLEQSSSAPSPCASEGDPKGRALPSLACSLPLAGEGVSASSFGERRVAPDKLSSASDPFFAQGRVINK